MEKCEIKHKTLRDKCLMIVNFSCPVLEQRKTSMMIHNKNHNVVQSNKIKNMRFLKFDNLKTSISKIKFFTDKLIYSLPKINGSNCSRR